LRRAKAIVLTVVVLLAVGFGCWELIKFMSAPPPPAAPPPPVPVNAAKVKIENVPAIVLGLGTVQSVDTVDVTSRVDGQIMAIYFKQGDEVKKGQKLFLIDPRPYQAALTQAQGQLAHDQAALAEAKVDLSRYQTLVAENSIAKQTEQDQAYVVAQDQGAVTTDQANVALAALNLSYCQIDAPIAGRTGELLVDLGNYVTASGSTPSSSAGASASAGASSIGAASTTSASPSTTTPLSNGTSSSPAGAASSAGASPLVTITQMQPIFVSFSVPETQLDTIRENQAKGPLSVEAYSQTGKLLTTGKLTLINNAVDTTTGTITLEGTFPNQRELLWPGDFVSARLIEFIRQNALTVPVSAVMTGPNGSYVYVIGAGNKVSRVNVEVTATDGNVAVIGKGLQAGEQVVTNGQYRLDNGVAVSIAAPAAAAGG
jgi:membrane fusion protein, multidrug efflux system